MQLRKQGRAPTCALALLFLMAGVAAASAQEGEPARPQAGSPARPEVNHEVHLHLLVTADGAEAAARVPQALEGVVRQLKAAMPSADYRVAATFINRVRDGGQFELKSVGGGAPFSSAQTPRLLHTGYLQLSLSGVRLLDAASERPSINIQHFRLGMKVPVHATSAAAGASPVFQYEDVGVSTVLSVREGEPTLVGTLNTSVPGQHFVIVITVRRTGK